MIQKLIWNPEECFFGSIDEHAAMLSASSNSALFDIEKPYVTDPTGALVMSGVPSLDDVPSQDHRDIPGTLRSVLSTLSPCELHRQLGGTWSIADYRDQTVTAFSDFSGFNAIFYAECDGMIAISNKAGLLRPFANRYALLGTSDINKRALSWVPATTMIQGHDTAYAGVKKIPPGHFCRIDRSGLRIFRHKTTFFDPIDIGGDENLETFVAERAQKIASRAKWYIGRGIRLGSHITGGRDSRTILSVLHASGLVNSLEQLATVGEEDNGDVIIARQVVKALGLENLHKVSPGVKSSATRSIDEVRRTFAHSIAKYDGQVTPFDGARGPSPRFPYMAVFVGGGGEIYRPKAIRSLQTLNEAHAEFINWAAPHDPLSALTRRTKNWQLREIKSRLSDMYEANIPALHTKYYIDQRLSNWGSGHWQGSAGNQIPLLLDLDLCRVLFRRMEFGETIHYLIIKALAPRLLEIPFFLQPWFGPTLQRAVADGYAVEPLAGHMRQNFPWQFEFCQTHQEMLVADLLAKPLGPFEQTINKRKLARAARLKIINSAQVKSLYGLFSGRALDDARTLRDPDAPDTETVFSGNFAPLLEQLGRGNGDAFAETLF